MSRKIIIDLDEALKTGIAEDIEDETDYQVTLDEAWHVVYSEEKRALLNVGVVRVVDMNVDVDIPDPRDPSRTVRDSLECLATSLEEIVEWVCEADLVPSRGKTYYTRLASHLLTLSGFVQEKAVNWERYKAVEELDHDDVLGRDKILATLWTAVQDFKGLLEDPPLGAKGEDSER